MVHDRRRLRLGGGSWRGRLGLVGVALLLAGAVTAISSGATERHDIIFLVDQSGSMFRAHGPNESWKPNDDPILGYRIEVIGLAYEELQSRLNQQQETRATYGIHVIEFAGKVRAHPPIEVAYDPARPVTQQQIQGVRNRLETLKRPAGLESGETDTQAGLREVWRLIQSLKAGPAGEIHVILITDGRPYAVSNGTPIAHLPAYAAEMRNLAGSITGSGADFGVIGLQRQDSKDIYWPTWGPFWTQAASPNSVHALDDANKIPGLVDQLVRGWLKLPPAQGVKNPYFCPPYLRSVTFTVYKRQPGASVEIRDAQGRLMTSGVPGVRVSDQRSYARIEVDRPIPGLWELDRSAADIRAEPFYRRIQRLSPKGSVNVQIPVTLRYQVLSEQGDVFRELPKYPISAEVKIVEASGKSESIPVSHSGNGVFGAERPYQFSDHGEARLTLTAMSKLDDGTPVEAFRASDSIQVTARELLVLDAGETLPTEQSLRFGNLNIDTKLAVRRFPSETVIPLREVSERPQDLLEFRLVSSDGTIGPDWPGWTKLTVDQEIFSGQTHVGWPILSKDWLLRRPRQLFAEFRVNDEALSDRFLVREIRRASAESESDEEAGESEGSFDPSQALPELLDNPMAAPLIAREPWSTYLVVLAGVAAGSVAGLALLFLVGGFVVFTAVDSALKQTSKVVIQPIGGDDFQERSKMMTGRHIVWYRKRQVAIVIGEDPDEPKWKPHWLVIRRLVRPWGKDMRVKLYYPAPAAKGTRLSKTVLRQGERPIRLNGVEGVEAFLEVKRRGKVVGDDRGWE